MKSPLFSILIANYNNGQFLTEAINSVRKQTYTNWEIIIVDDKSTDSSLDLYHAIEHSKDERIKIYYNSSNHGCGYTKNQCVLNARGEICAFLDPDDALTPNAIETMVKLHNANPKASLVYSTYYKCDKNLRVEYINESSCTIPPHTDYLHYQRGAVHAFASFKRIAIINACGINPTFQRAVDQDLYLKLEEQGQLVFHYEPLYYYRFHYQSISIFDNTLKARYWHIIAIHDACRRRGIPQEAESIVEEMLKLNIGDSDMLRHKLEEYQHPSFLILLKIFKRWITTIIK